MKGAWYSLSFRYNYRQEKLEYQQKARTEQECFGVRKQNELKKMGKALFVNFVSVTEQTSIIIV